MQVGLGLPSLFGPGLSQSQRVEWAWRSVNTDLQHASLLFIGFAPSLLFVFSLSHSSQQNRKSISCGSASNEHTLSSDFSMADTVKKQALTLG